MGTKKTLIGNVRGPKGETPKKGVDYWTEDDRQEIIEQITPKMIGVATTPNLLDNSDWTNLVDQKQGRIILSGVTYYSDTELTMVAGETKTGSAVRERHEGYDVIMISGKTYYTNPEDSVRGYAHLNQYVFDRWYSTVSIRFVIKDGYVTVDNFTTSASGATQYIPKELSPKEGESITLAMETADGTIYVGNMTMIGSGSKYILSNGNVSFRIDAPSESTGGLVALRMFVIAGKSESVKWIALYRGLYTADTLPPYQPKGYATEYAVCRQYDPSTGAYIGLTYESFGKEELVNLVLEALPTWEGGSY